MGYDERIGRIDQQKKKRNYRSLRNFLPELSKEKIEEIRYAFYPFMYGIYPYAHPTDK